MFFTWEWHVQKAIQTEVRYPLSNFSYGITDPPSILIEEISIGGQFQI
jgi:hypothetical protein